MKRIALTALIAACLLGALYFLLDDAELRTEKQDELPQDQKITEGSALQSAPSPSGPARREKLRDENEPVEKPPAPKQQAATVFVGRCVLKETEEPLAGCEVRVMGLSLKTLSGPDGRFSLDVSGVTRPFFALLAGRHDMCGMENHAHPALGQTKDLGDVPMTVGTSLSGLVVDAKKTTVASAELVFVHQKIQRTTAGWTRCKFTPTVSSSDGSFRTPCALWPGPYKISCILHPVVAPKTLALKPNQAPGHLQVEVQRRNPQDIIAGSIYRENGAPAAGVELVLLGSPSSAAEIAAQEASIAKMPKGLRPQMPAISPKARLRLSQTRTDDSGRFHFIVSSANRRARDRDGAWIEVRQTATHRRHTTGRVAWSTQDVHISLLPRETNRPAARIAVVDDATGKPVLAYEARWSEVGSEDYPYRRSFRPNSLGAGPHPEGRVSIPALDDGHYTISIRPADKERFSPMTKTIIFPQNREETLICRLKPQIEFTIEVVDSQGNAAAASNVFLRGSSTQHRNMFSSISRKGKTDANGRLKMRRPPELFSVDLSVIGQHLPAVKKIESLTREEGRYRITVRRGTKVRGRVVPRKRWQELSAFKPTLTTSFVGKSGRAGFGKSIQPNADGAFESPPLAPGEHRVTLVLPNPRGPFRVPLPSVIQVDEDPGEIVIDISKVQVGALRGRWLVNGEPCRNTKFILAYDGLSPHSANSPKPGKPGWTPSSIRFISTDDEGEFSIPEGPRGFYRVQSLTDSCAPVEFIPGAEPLVLRSLRQVLAIQLTDAAGNPLSGARSVSTSAGSKTTDENGRLEVTLRPSTPLVLYRKSEDGKRTKVGSYEVRGAEPRTLVQVPWIDDEK